MLHEFADNQQPSFKIEYLPELFHLAWGQLWGQLIPLLPPVAVVSGVLMHNVGLGSAGLGEVVDVPVDLTGVRLDPHLTQPAIAHDPVLVVTNEPLEGNKNEMKVF